MDIEQGRTAICRCKSLSKLGISPGARMDKPAGVLSALASRVEMGRRPRPRLYVGEVTGDGIQLIFDYGGFSWTLDPRDDPEHDYAVNHEDIGGFEAKLLISLNDRAGYTGVYFQIPVSQISGKDRGYISLNLVGEGLTQEEQHTAISVFRGIRFLRQ